MTPRTAHEFVPATHGSWPGSRCGWQRARWTCGDGRCASEDGWVARGGLIKWDSEQLAYVDRFENRWRKGPSRIPGQPFEWDVQLDPSSAWTKYSKDGKHLNVDLDGYRIH